MLRLPKVPPLKAKMKAMAAVSRLNPVASPFVLIALLPASYYLSPTPAAAIPSPDFFASQFLLDS
jgi:hypothetical protein